MCICTLVRSLSLSLTLSLSFSLFPTVPSLFCARHDRDCDSVNGNCDSIAFCDRSLNVTHDPSHRTCIALASLIDGEFLIRVCFFLSSYTCNHVIFFTLSFKSLALWYPLPNYNMEYLAKVVKSTCTCAYAIMGVECVCWMLKILPLKSGQRIEYNVPNF